MRFILQKQKNEKDDVPKIKFVVTLLVFWLIVISSRTIGLAEGIHKVTGEVTKVEGDMVTIKDEKGKEHTVLTDETTEMFGEVKQGAKVDAEMTEKGHAAMITIRKGDGKIDPSVNPGGCPREKRPCNDPPPKPTP